VSEPSTGPRPLCFVLMPFGTKDDPAGGQVHFDAVHEEIIRPAVEDAGMQCVRADEERVGGIIHRPMFERLLLCDYAVADLSMANANVYYELGIRHATRPWSTVLLFREGFRLPFDVGPLRAQPYHLGPDGRPARDHVAPDRAALTASLRHARDATTDSPLFQLLPELPPADTSVLGTELFREQVEATRALQGRLTTARRERDLDGMRAVRADLGGLDGRDAGLVVDLLRSFLAVEAYDDAVALVAAMPPIAGRIPVVREQLAFALNRLGRRDEAEDVLLRLVEERGADSETSGLLGRVYKDQWADALEHGRTARAGGLLEKAIAAYLAGFEADWRDHYPGINAVQLMYLRDPSDPRIAELLPVVRYGARQKARRRQADYWDHATLLELAVLEDSVEDAETALMHALAADPLPWQARSTLATLVRLRVAREGAGPTPDWLRTVETELAEAADPTAG
jgi:tetratricopeptide (TPR) repeat protein